MRYQEYDREGRRNPYLADYGQRTASRRVTGAVEQGNVRRMPQRETIPGSDQEAVGQRTADGYREAGRQRTAVKYRETGRQRTAVKYRETGRQRAAVKYRETDRQSAAVRYGETDRQRATARRREAARRRELARRKRLRRQRLMLFGALGCILVLAVFLIRQIGRAPEVDGSVMPKSNVFSNALNGLNNKVQGLDAEEFAKHPDWTEDFLTPNEYSRPGEPLPEVKNIFVHYTANKNTSAAQNRSYFENLKDNHETSASAHFIIGYNGEIIQCIPLDEIAYAVQTRNYDSISIECCYKAENGSFTQETYDSLLSLLRWLLDIYDLQPEDILRHYDCGGKKCPLYYTENPDAWEKLKEDVAEL